MNKQYCKCGCGQEIIFKSHHKYYGIPDYIWGHHHKGKSNYWNIKEIIKIRTSRGRANKLCKKENCDINNNDCSKRLEIHHIDSNPLNNKIENLVCLCKSHHLLIEKRKLTIDELKNINFKYYVDKSGKRRYIRK